MSVQYDVLLLKDNVEVARTRIGVGWCIGNSWDALDGALYHLEDLKEDFGPTGFDEVMVLLGDEWASEHLSTHLRRLGTR